MCCLKGSQRSEARSKLTKLCFRTHSYDATICFAKNRSLRSLFSTRHFTNNIQKTPESILSTQFLFMSLFKKVIKKRVGLANNTRDQHSNVLLGRRTKINFANCVFKAKW